MTDDNPTHKLEAVETIVVDPDDIIKTMQRNRRNEAEQVTHVLRVSPPLDGECRATTHCSQDGNYYPPEMDPKPHHFMPQDFLTGHTGESLPSHLAPPDRCTSRSVFKQDPHIDVPDNTSEWTEEDDAKFESYFEESKEIWCEEVRAACKDTITSEILVNTFENGQLRTKSLIETIDVEYISNDNETDQ